MKMFTFSTMLLSVESNIIYRMQWLWLCYWDNAFLGMTWTKEKNQLLATWSRKTWNIGGLWYMMREVAFTDDQMFQHFINCIFYGWNLIFFFNFSVFVIYMRIYFQLLFYCILQICTELYRIVKFAINFIHLSESREITSQT